MTNNQPLLSVRGLCASAGDLEILNGVDLEVFPERSMPSWDQTLGEEHLGQRAGGPPRLQGHRRRSPL